MTTGATLVRYEQPSEGSAMHTDKESKSYQSLYGSVEVVRLETFNIHRNIDMMFLVSAVRGNPNFDCFVAVDIIAMFPFTTSASIGA